MRVPLVQHPNIPVLSRRICSRNATQSTAFPAVDLLKHAARHTQLLRSDHGRVMSDPRLTGAIAYYREKLKQNPSNPAHHHNIAPLLFEGGDVRAAMRHYRRAFQLNPKDINSKNDLAVILWRMGKWEAALAALCQVLMANSEHYEANVNLAAVYFKQGAYELAVRHGRKATHIRPTSPKAHRVLGQILDQMGNVEMSLHHRKIAVRRGPGGGKSHQHDTHTYKKIGAQLVTLGQGERENSHAFVDCYRAMAGKPIELATSERTNECLRKCRC